MAITINHRSEIVLNGVPMGYTVCRNVRTRRIMRVTKINTNRDIEMLQKEYRLPDETFERDFLVAIGEACPISNTDSSQRTSPGQTCSPLILQRIAECQGMSKMSQPGSGLEELVEAHGNWGDVRPLMQSMVWHNDQCFLVSTVERDTRGICKEISRFSEILAWEYDAKNNTRGKLVFISGDVENSLVQHIQLCEKLHHNGTPCPRN